MPLNRPRFNKKTGAVYDSQVYEKRGIKRMMFAQCRFPVTGPLSLICLFHMQIPQSASKIRQAQLCGTPHDKRPDWDNLIKWIGDCGNDILWADDAQIWCVQGWKVWSHQPQTTIYVAKQERVIFGSTPGLPLNPASDLHQAQFDFR